jgi:preprotein translocase subunit SecE
LKQEIFDTYTISLMNKKEVVKPEEENVQAGDQMASLLKDTKDEFAKIVWPSRQQLISESIAVILMVTLVATIIYLVDNFFSWGASRIFG